MPRALTPERQQELDSLRAILLVFADFQRPYFDGKLADVMVETVEKACCERALSELRMMRDDMVAMSDGCTAEQMRQLAAMLRESRWTTCTRGSGHVSPISASGGGSRPRSSTTSYVSTWS